MQIHGFEEILTAHPVFSEFEPDLIELLAGCAKNVHFAAGDTIYAEGGSADAILILRHGDVAVEISAPHRAPMIVETLHEGDILGWSWIVPPYRHASDARALSEVRAISLDAVCLRGKCDANPVLGYRIFQHWLPHMARNVHALRMQLLDLYGSPTGG